MSAQDEQHLYSLPYEQVPVAPDDYNGLINKPKLNGYTIEGDKTAEDYDIVVPTKVSELENDLDFATESQIPTQLSQLANNVGFTTQAYVDDKISRVRDDIPTKTSDLTNDSNFVSSTSLATVATTGSYNDLIDKPSIPTKTSDLTNDSNFVSSTNLATVATTGSYNDLLDKPTIPINAYQTTDPDTILLDNSDYVPLLTNGGIKKKALLSNYIDKVKTEIGIGSGNTYLKKDGTWDTPTDTTYSAMTAAELKAGTATTLRTMRADYTKEGVRDIIGQLAGNDVIETLGGAATRTYEIGEYFFANDGYFYVATAKITSGATITSGTNCSKTSISGALENLYQQCFPKFFMLSSSNATIATTTGSVYGGWSARFAMYTDIRDSNNLGNAERNIVSDCIFLNVRLQNVSGKPKVTITSNDLKQFGNLYIPCICYRYSSSTPYPCDCAYITHFDGENKLTLEVSTFAYSGTPSGYFMFVR